MYETWTACGEETQGKQIGLPVPHWSTTHLALHAASITQHRCSIQTAFTRCTISHTAPPIYSLTQPASTPSFLEDARDRYLM